MDKSYNGWTNYETWNYKLWLDNDYGTQKHWQQMTEDLADKYTDTETNSTDREAVIYDLAKMLKEDIEEAAYDLCYRESSLYGSDGCLSDLLTHAIHRINFEEIAENLYEDYIWEEEHR